ncbi:hypothetical protein [Methylobacterium sp. D54C]
MPETEVMLSGQGGDLPTLGAIKPGNGPFFVVVDWAEGSRAGTTDVIDLAPVILVYKVLRPLRDNPALFATVRLSEYGDAIEWGPDDSLAVAGATLERLAEEAMTAAQFGAFMKRHHLTLDATAAQLGLSRRMVAYYAKGTVIPRTVALACLYLDAAAQSQAVTEPAAPTGAAKDPVYGLLTHPAAVTYTQHGSVKSAPEVACLARVYPEVAPALKGTGLNWNKTYDLSACGHRLVVTASSRRGASYGQDLSIGSEHTTSAGLTFAPLKRRLDI